MAKPKKPDTPAALPIDPLPAQSAGKPNRKTAAPAVVPKLAPQPPTAALRAIPVPMMAPAQLEPAPTSRAALVARAVRTVSRNLPRAPLSVDTPPVPSDAQAQTSSSPCPPDPAPASVPVRTAAPAGLGKQARMVELLRSRDGVTIGQLMHATGWLSHSVRGALSGHLKRKLGLVVENVVEPGRGRVYRIASHPQADPAPQPDATVANQRAAAFKRCRRAGDAGEAV